MINRFPKMTCNMKQQEIFGNETILNSVTNNTVEDLL